MTAAARKAFEPLHDHISGGYGKLAVQARFSPIKRNRSTTVLISQEGLNAMLAEGAKIDGTIGGMAGLVVDYLARNGRFGDLLKEAMAEHGAKT